MYFHILWERTEMVDKILESLLYTFLHLFLSSKICEMTEATILAADSNCGLESPFPLQFQQTQGELSGSLYSQICTGGG